MTRSIQIHHVPDDVHQRLKAMAAAAGKSLAAFLRLELDRLSRQPTATDIRERLAGLEPVVRGESSVAAVRAVRRARDRSRVC